MDPRRSEDRIAIVTGGAVEISGHTLSSGQMIVFATGGTVAVKALAPSTVMLIGGEPIGQRFVEWNVVSSSRERIAQAKADWRAGRMALPQADHDEFIPLPADPLPTAPPMS